MKVTTNQEISYSLRLSPTEARRLYFLFHNIAHCNSSVMTVVEKMLCKDLAVALHIEIVNAEGTNL